ncbi:MAG: response regulator [SAR324 cluster bacterium]|nr:response regulator [SAR324 cluster bacterium]
MLDTTLLIIHESAMLRRMFRKFIQSEFSHFTIIDVDSAVKAREMITHEKVDLIISGNQLKGLDGVELFKIKNQSKMNHSTPFILATSSNNSDALEEYKLAGLNEVLFLPITPVSLRATIKKVFDNRRKRRHDRFVIAGMEVVVHLNERDANADTVNFSRQSISCEFEVDPDEQAFFDSLYLTLKFPETYKSYDFPEIWCRLVQMKIKGWDKEFRANKVQVIWEFIDFPDDKISVWEGLISQLEKEYETMSGVKG